MKQQILRSSRDWPNCLRRLAAGPPCTLAAGVLHMAADGDVLRPVVEWNVANERQRMQTTGDVFLTIRLYPPVQGGHVTHSIRLI